VTEPAASPFRNGAWGAERVLALQRSLGNHGVTRMLSRQPDGGVPADAGPGPAPAEDDESGAFARFFGGMVEAAIEEATNDPERLREAVGAHIAENGMTATQTAIEDIRSELAILRGNRGDMHGVSPEREELGHKIERRERFLAAVQAVLTEYDRFLDLFEAQGLLVIGGMLRISESRVAQEKQRYGLQTNTTVTSRYSPSQKETVYDIKTSHSMADNEQSKGLAKAAAELAAKVDAIRAATNARDDTLGPVPSPDGDGTILGIVDEQAHAAAEKQIAEAYKDYDLLRYEKEAEFPILAAYTAIDKQGGTAAIASTAKGLRKIAAGGAGAADSLAPDVDKRLENIKTVREGIADGDIRVWEMPDIVELTKQQLGVAPGSARARAIDEKVEGARTFKVARDILLGVVAIALSMAAAPLTGGASLGLGAAVVAGTAAAAGAGLAVYVAVEHLQEYQLEKAKGGTDFERARALSQEDPSLFWLALDIVGAVLEVKTMLAAFKALAPTARAAVAARRAATSAEQIARAEGKELAELREAAQRQLGKAGAGEQVVKSAERAAAKEQSQLKGVHSKWESELGDDSKKLLKDEPGVAATFREMDPEVRELLTRCGSLCIPPKATKAQAQRLRKLLDKIPPRHRHGLKEFLYHHRESLDTAIKDLEELFSKDLGREVEKAIDALEEGRLPQQGELTSASRRGKPENVPDLAGGAEAGQRVPLELLRKNQNVLGKTIAGAPENVQQAWNAARKDVLAAKGPLTADNYKQLYSEAQRKFWANVRADSGGAAKWFEENGFSFASTQTGAPAVALEYSGRSARKEFAIELDHMLPKGTGNNWTKALDADNLQFLTGWDNWLLNQIERVAPELAR
jgi:hypothetical protein